MLTNVPKEALLPQREATVGHPFSSIQFANNGQGNKAKAIEIASAAGMGSAKALLFPNKDVIPSVLAFPDAVPANILNPWGKAERAECFQINIQEQNTVERSARMYGPCRRD